MRKNPWMKQNIHKIWCLIFSSIDATWFSHGWNYIWIQGLSIARIIQLSCLVNLGVPNFGPEKVNELMVTWWFELLAFWWFLLINLRSQSISIFSYQKTSRVSCADFRRQGEEHDYSEVGGRTFLIYKDLPYDVARPVWQRACGFLDRLTRNGND